MLFLTNNFELSKEDNTLSMSIQQNGKRFFISSNFSSQCRDLEANNRILVAQLECGKVGLSTAIVTLQARLQLELEEIKSLIVSSHSCRLELKQRLDLLEEYYERKQAEYVCTCPETLVINVQSFLFDETSGEGNNFCFTYPNSRTK